MNQLSVIVSPVDDCNLACRYCIEPHQRTGTIMELNTVHKIMEMVSKYATSMGKTTRFIWHGGEPLLACQNIFDFITQYSKKLSDSGHKISHAVQTNGTQFSLDRADFFAKHGFDISFSLDGPKRYNDLTRVYLNEGSSFNDAYEGIITNINVTGSANAICVISAANIAAILEIDDFFQNNNISIQYNPFYHLPGKSCDLQITPNQYADAIIMLFRKWFKSNKTDSIGTNSTALDYTLSCLYSIPISCTFKLNCQLDDFYAIDAQGNVVPCSRFFSNSDYIYGNINFVEDFSKIASSKKRAELQMRHLEIRECNDCSYQNICNSGCMHQALMGYGSIYNKDPFCLAYKRIFSYVSNSISTSLEKAKV